MGEVDGSVRRVLLPWRQGPRRSRSVRIASTSTTPNASISGHPASPCCDGTSTPHRAQMRIASNISVSSPNRGCLASPASYPPRACLGHDPGRLLAQVGDRLQDVPATLAFELMDPAHPIVDGVLDERARAADGALDFGRSHAASIGVSRSSAHRPFGSESALVEVRYRGMLVWPGAASSGKRRI